MASFAEQVRLRLREEMTRKKLSQRDIAGLTGWSQSKVAHQLTAHTEIKLDDLAAFCFAVGLSVTEVVRDHGLEFCAEMTPTELRILERVRQLEPPVLDAILTLLDVKTKTRPQLRRAGSPTKKIRSAR